MIHLRNEPCKYIVAWHDVWPEVMAVWPKGGDNQENGHAGKDKNTHAEVIVLVCEKEIGKPDCYIAEPQNVRNDKDLHKGDVVIHGHMYDAVLLGYCLFQIFKPQKPCTVKQKKGQGVSVFGD